MTLLDKIMGGNRSAAELIPITDQTDEAFLLQDGTIFDMMQITTKDLVSSSEDSIMYDINIWVKFYRTYADDFKIISINYPTDTKQQMGYIRYKMSQTKNPVFLHHLSVRLGELERVQQLRTDREYYLIYFSPSIEKHRENTSRIRTILGGYGLAKPLEMAKKMNILSKLANKNSSIFI